jgi:lipopolysaccharide/colanic/teichoic acid biosynthesis glycosyltransferase
LPEYYRFSRALIILGAAWGVIIMPGLRVLLHFMNVKSARIGSGKNRRFIIIGEKEETERVSGLLQKTFVSPAFVGLVSYHQHKHNANGFIGHLGQIEEIITIHRINEVIFCAKDIPAQVIIDKMSDLKHQQVDYKIAPPESLSIIGSNSINTAGDLYVIDINAITKTANRRNKRLLDMLISLILLIFYPVALFFVRNPLGLLRNLFSVLFASRSLVGYTLVSDTPDHRLPKIRKGILSPVNVIKEKDIPCETSVRLNIMYARDYKLTNDLIIIYKGFRELGAR